MGICPGLKWPAFFMSFLAVGSFIGWLLWLGCRPALPWRPSLAAGALLGLVTAFFLAPVYLFVPSTKDRRDPLK